MDDGECLTGDVTEHTVLDTRKQRWMLVIRRATATTSQLWSVANKLIGELTWFEAAKAELWRRGITLSTDAPNQNFPEINLKY